MDCYKETKDIKCQHCEKLIGQDGLYKGFFDPYMEPSKEQDFKPEDEPKIFMVANGEHRQIYGNK